jgi:hypothetical protein
MVCVTLATLLPPVKRGELARGTVSVAVPSDDLSVALQGAHDSGLHRPYGLWSPAAAGQSHSRTRSFSAAGRRFMTARSICGV